MSLNISCAFGQPDAHPIPQPSERVNAFVARWDAWVETIPHDQRAWPIVQEVDKIVNEARGDDHWFASSPPIPDEDGYIYEGAMKDWNWTVEFLNNNPGLIEQIHLYTSMPYMGSRLDESSRYYRELGDRGYVIENTPFPKTIEDIVPAHLGMTRASLDILLADMFLAQKAKDEERVFQDIQAIAGLARLSITTGNLLDFQMTPVYGGAIERRLLKDEIEMSQFSSVQLADIQSLLRGISELTDIAQAMETERIAAHEFLEWIYEDSSDGRITPLGVARFIDTKESYRFWSMYQPEVKPDRFGAAMGALMLSFHIADKADQDEYVTQAFDAIHADLQIPIHELRAWATPKVSNSNNKDIALKMKYAPALFHTGGFQMDYLLSNTPTQNHAAQLLIALHRHKLRHGEFPTNYEMLDADLLPQPLIDMYSGQPLKFKLVAGEPIIYSVGTDRDDDGGVPIAGWDKNWPEFLALDELDARNESDPASIDGDWILYPVER